jgi:hypothetical protein
MKNEKLLLVLLLVIGLKNLSLAQNCKLINSATFNVPPSKKNILLKGSVLRMINSTFSQVDPNQWNYIAWVKTTNNGGKIYKNGTLVFSGMFENQNYVYNRLDLGAENYFGWGGFFDGLIDEVRISNKERSANEIFNSYNLMQPFSADNNTIGLWHFDENSGSNANSVVGPSGSITSGNWSPGIFGSCINFNGLNSRASMNLQMPTSNMTVEFWIKPNGMPSNRQYPISLWGGNITTFILNPDTTISKYIWSTGDTSSSITVNPSQHSYIWVTDGYCKDTIWFNSNQIRVTDTCITKITKYDTIKVMDTLEINANLSGISAPNNTNRIIVYPNPTKDHITIDYGVFSKMSGYTMKITNTLGQTVFSSPINQQSSFINLSSWTGKGVYYIQIIDPQSNMIENRKIVLQ